MTKENNSSKDHDTHEVLSTFRYVELPDYIRVAVDAYDPVRGTLKTTDEDGYGGNEYKFDGEKWVCTDSYHEVEGDLHFDEVVGAAKCGECADIFTATDATENYCGCRH